LVAQNETRVILTVALLPRANYCETRNEIPTQVIGLAQNTRSAELVLPKYDPELELVQKYKRGQCNIKYPCKERHFSSTLFAARPTDIVYTAILLD
jgi:hypothetical protein